MQLLSKIFFGENYSSSLFFTQRITAAMNITSQRKCILWLCWDENGLPSNSFFACLLCDKLLLLSMQIAEDKSWRPLYKLATNDLMCLTFVISTKAFFKWCKLQSIIANTYCDFSTNFLLHFRILYLRWFHVIFAKKKWWHDSCMEMARILLHDFYGYFENFPWN